ncbi:hypothetical protein BKA58DRAFT_443841 [Alternaria rosae]|uniref:uncharacterized protein n=1 Tax=Alternaria rosae TaxID=1187941 RepID=UPI001E8E41C7|nr:uncharacterized protein BKA58DRAFT_443841 [Alternaria rosae]KAH6861073.1 hypothetical protein BKA58DRAFT_443841 [Alternaria rosae]
MTETGIAIPTSGEVSPFAPFSLASTSENCSSSSSSSDSNASSIPDMAQTTDLPSPDRMEFSPYRQSDDDFLQGLPDFIGSQCGTPKQTANCYYPMSPDFPIAPELLDMGFCGAPWEQQQREHEQHQSDPSTMLLAEGLPYFGLLTPDGHHPCYHPDQQYGNTPMPTTSSKNFDGCSYVIPSQQQVHPQFPQPSDDASLSPKSCNCVPTLLDHLSTSSYSPSSSPIASTSAALSTSRMLITCCCNTMACPNACSTRPSTALVICEAIDRALVSLKLGGTSLWTPSLASTSSCDSGASSPPSSSLSSSSTTGGTSVIDEEHEPLRCGTLPIRGADRRAVVRVLLVKRVLEAQRVLERLRDALLSGLLVDGEATVKNPLLALCADVAGEFATKVAERVETVKLQM